MTMRRPVTESAPLVLIVGHDQTTREMYAEFLTYSGYRVALADAAEEAVEKARQLHPSLITTSIGLQNGDDGCVLCERLKRDDDTGTIPVVVVTAWALGGHIERAKRAGCDAVLLKPCPPTTLLSEIRRYLGN
jgi:two-component system, cell cycle response regulator DivK